MDRSCPKRKKTKKVISDNDVTKYLTNPEVDLEGKIVHIGKIPEEWDTGLTLNLYHDGFTLLVNPHKKMPSEKIPYDESDFIRSIELGEIPDVLVPLLGDLTMISDNKLLVTVLDYRGFPRPGTSDPYILDFPITKRHLLTRSLQSMVLELYETLGDRIPHSQLTQLENLMMLHNCPPLCLDNNPHVLEVKSEVHENQNALRTSAMQRMLDQHTRTGDVPCSLLQDVATVVLSNPDKGADKTFSAKASCVDGKLKKIPIPATTAPNFLSEIRDLCSKHATAAAPTTWTQQEILARQPGVSPLPAGYPQPVTGVAAGYWRKDRHVSSDKTASAKAQHINETMRQQPEPSPQPGAGFNAPSMPHLKPAPFIANKPTVSVHPGMGAVSQGSPISPNIAGQQSGMTSHNSPMVSGPPGSHISPLPGPGAPPRISPAPKQQSPKNVAAVSRIPADAMNKGVRGYAPGYLVQQSMSRSNVPTQQVQPMVSMIPLSQQQGTMMPQQQTGGIIRAPGQIMHIASPHMRPANPGHVDQSASRPVHNSGMVIGQQYPRTYQYQAVQPMSRGGYVEAGQYMAVQQQPRQVMQQQTRAPTAQVMRQVRPVGPGLQQARPGQVMQQQTRPVLQISLPPNMNPHQTTPRQAVAVRGLGQQLTGHPHQQPLHRVPYNQVQIGGTVQSTTLQPQRIQQPMPTQGMQQTQAMPAQSISAQNISAQNISAQNMPAQNMPAQNMQNPVMYNQYH